MGAGWSSSGVVMSNVDMFSDTRPYIGFVGDSITFGYTSTHQWGYRKRVLLDSNVQFRSVGPSQRGKTANLFGHPTSRLDNYHIAVVGYTSAQIETLLDTALANQFANNPPNSWIVIHAGTNDCISGQNYTAATTNIQDMIDAIQVHDPSISVVVVLVPPLDTADANAVACIPLLNSAIETMVAGYDKSNLYTADAYSVFDGHLEYLAGDGIHPLDTGSDLYGTVIANVINAALQ